MMETVQRVLLLSGERSLVVKTNGGSVNIEKQIGDDWVVTDTIAEDGVWRLDFGQTRTRFSPVGGAVYEVTR